MRKPDGVDHRHCRVVQLAGAFISHASVDVRPWPMVWAVWPPALELTQQEQREVCGEIIRRSATAPPRDREGP
jgi:hypothetical protein